MKKYNIYDESSDEDLSEEEVFDIIKTSTEEISNIFKYEAEIFEKDFDGFNTYKIITPFMDRYGDLIEIYISYEGDNCYTVFGDNKDFKYVRDHKSNREKEYSLNKKISEIAYSCDLVFNGKSIYTFCNKNGLADSILYVSIAMQTISGMAIALDE